MALQDFVSAGISWGGIAIDAPEANVMSNAAVAKARTFAMMTLSSSNKFIVAGENPQSPFDLAPLRSFGISAAVNSGPPMILMEAL